MESPEQDQHSSREGSFHETPERVSDHPDTDNATRLRERNRMLLNYIELVSEYQDSRRSAGTGESSLDPYTPEQDIPDMPPPPGLVQLIHDAGGNLAACDAVILYNLRLMSQLTGRDTILYTGAFRHGDRGPSPDAVINEDDISAFGDILDRLNRQDDYPDPNLSFHPHPHGAHREFGHYTGPHRPTTGHDQRQLDLILHSPGGTLSATQAIVRALRGRYAHIRVFVPQRAMSAAAMLACAADQIIMGGFASLSPTNPMVVVPTIGGSMMVPAQAVVDERNELLRRLQGSEATGEDLMTLVAQPPGLFHEARRIISECSLTLGGWVESYSRAPDAPQANTGQHIADWISSYNQHLGHASVLTLADLQRYGLNATHMNGHADVQEHCMEAFHATQVAFVLTDTVKVYGAISMRTATRRTTSESLQRHPTSHRRNGLTGSP